MNYDEILKAIMLGEKIYNLHLRVCYYCRVSTDSDVQLNSLDNQGLSGLELKYDKYLTGKNGMIKYFSDAHGNKLNKSDVYIEPVSGMDINLTIDINIQKSLEREMDNINSMFNPDMALAIVVNPKTGELLGISSLPSYDPNNYKNYTTEVLSRNLPIFASYEPGSTFKNVTPLFSNFILKL